MSVRYTYVTAFIPYWHNSLQRKKKQKKNKTRPAAKGFSLRHDKDFRVGTDRKQKKKNSFGFRYRVWIVHILIILHLK